MTKLLFASDLLCVIAHGTPNARAPAANLLFYYWPNLNPTHFDRRNMLNRSEFFIIGKGQFFVQTCGKEVLNLV